MRLVDPISGTVRFKGLDITALPQRRIRPLRRHFQMIYQDPYESLNPRYRVRDIVAEPLRIHGRGDSARTEHDLVLEALERVDLRPAGLFVDRYPHELSGGQRQRVAIAASLIVSPDLLVADEPVSMLDVSVRAGLMALLRRLCDESHIGVLMITHDLAVAGHYADRIAVMYLGRIVETGSAKEVLQNPKHPYTVALRRAAPSRNRDNTDRGRILAGEAPNAISIPSGCRFRPRCPLAHERCERVDPKLVPVVGSAGHEAACVLVGATDTNSGDLIARTS
jgi:peptide/nickel transport system ATP-binding protein